MTSLFPPFNRRASFRKQPYFFEQGRGVFVRSTGQVTPVLNLNFLSGVLDPRITFSRPSLATMYDSTGKLTYAPNNLFLQSQTFQTTWSAAGATVTADQATAPDGTLTADKLTTDGTAAIQRIFQAVTYVGQAIFSVYAKAGTAGFLQIINSANANIYANFNLSTGVVGTAGSAVTSGIQSIGSGWYRCWMVYTRASGNEQIYVAPSASAAYGAAYSASVADLYVWGAQIEAVTYQTTPRTYVATTSAAYYGPRFDYNPSTLAARGLLIEEARTNLCLYSDQFNNAAWSVAGALAISANSTTSPDGTINADTLSAVSGSNPHCVYTTTPITATLASNYAGTVYVKKNTSRYVYVSQGNAQSFATAVFDLDGGGSSATQTSTGGSGTAGVIVGTSQESVGSGWYRLSIIAATTSLSRYLTFGIASAATGNTFDASGNVVFNAAGTESIYIWGADLEAGAFATSYIPTGSSSVARSADSVYMTGTNFSSWYNQSEGTVLAQYAFAGFGSSGYPVVFSITDNSGFGTNSLRVVREAGTTSAIVDMYSGGGVQASWTVANKAVIGTSYKNATAYKLNDTNTTFDGTSQTTDTSCSVLATATYANFGNYASSASTSCVWIQSFTYYRTRLSNTRLQALTQ